MQVTPPYKEIDEYADMDKLIDKAFRGTINKSKLLENNSQIWMAYNPEKHQNLMVPTMSTTNDMKKEMNSTTTTAKKSLPTWKAPIVPVIHHKNRVMQKMPSIDNDLYIKVIVLLF